MSLSSACRLVISFLPVESRAREEAGAVAVGEAEVEGGGGGINNSGRVIISTTQCTGGEGVCTVQNFFGFRCERVAEKLPSGK